MNRRHLLIAGTLLLANCASVAVTPEAGMVELEPLLAVVIEQDRVTIRLTSTGCTVKETMAFYVEKQRGRYALAFARRRLDRCDAAPMPVDLTWTFAELGLPRGARVVVVNPQTHPSR